MSLRLYKLVVPQSQVDKFVAFSKEVVKPTMLPFTKPNGVRFFQARNSAVTFFLTVWWSEKGSAQKFDRTDSGDLMRSISLFIAERIQYWDLQILEDDYSPKLPKYFNEHVFIRMSKISVSPALAGRMLAEFNKYTDSVTRKQPGCLSVKLMKSVNSADVYFLTTIWEKEEDFKRFSTSKYYREIRSSSLSYLENRIETWPMRLIVSEENVYKIMGGVLDKA